MGAVRLLGSLSGNGVYGFSVYAKKMALEDQFMVWYVSSMVVVIRHQPQALEIDIVPAEIQELAGFMRLGEQ